MSLTDLPWIGVFVSERIRVFGAPEPDAFTVAIAVAATTSTDAAKIARFMARP